MRLWHRLVNADTGEITVDDYPGSVWDTGDLAGPQRSRSDRHRARAQQLADKVRRERSTQRDLTDQRALTEAMPAVVNAIVNGLRPRKNEDTERTEKWARMRGEEVLDRAYNALRIRNAGVDMTLHPQFQTYQAFYELGFPPPTHEEMADHIIATLGEEKPARTKDSTDGAEKENGDR